MQPSPSRMRQEIARCKALGVGHYLGKPALAAMKDGPNRKKVTFEWNGEDVVKVIASAFSRGGPPP